MSALFETSSRTRGLRRRHGLGLAAALAVGAAGPAAAGYPDFDARGPDSVVEPPALQETGSWLSRAGRERVFLTIFTSGRYRVVREQDRDDGRINAQWDVGTFSLDAGRLLLTRQRRDTIADCPEGLEGAFTFKILGKRLLLHGRRATFTFAPRLDGARAVVPAPPSKAVHGCFRRKQFQPDYVRYPALLTGSYAPPPGGNGPPTATAH